MDESLLLDDDDDESYRSAFDSQQRILDHQKKLLATPPLESEKEKMASNRSTFNTHSIENCPTDSNLIEQAKILAQ